jgi:hypothetical protein
MSNFITFPSVIGDLMMGRLHPQQAVCQSKKYFYFKGLVKVFRNAAVGDVIFFDGNFVTGLSFLRIGAVRRSD